MGRIAFWDVTSRCNLRCTHCYAADYHSRDRSIDCTTEQALTILDRLRGAAYDTLWILGGEPLVRKDIAELVAGACERGFEYVRLVTNGTLLTPALVADLGRAGLHELSVSLDGPDALSNDELRGAGSFAKAVRGLETALAHRPAAGKPEVFAQLTLTRATLDQGEEMVRFAGEMGLDGLSIVELKLMGSAVQHSEALYPTLVEAMDARETIVEAAARFPDLTLQVFGRPRVIAYLNDRYDARLSMGMPMCALENGYRYLHVKASGRVTPCSVVDVDAVPEATSDASVPLTESVPEQLPDKLYEHDLDGLLCHPLFDGVRRTVDDAVTEKWQDEFAPCARCPFRSRCFICPLYLQQVPDKLIRECLIALQRHSQWKKAGRPPARAAASASG